MTFCQTNSRFLPDESPPFKNQAKAKPSLRTGAGGVGGLVSVSVDGDFDFPGYDNNGNVVGYWDESGSIVTEYAFDAFGNTISSSGSMASVFPHRFSTKYYDTETDLYYYGYRYYSPSLGRWISRDPIEEEGGFGLYIFCENNSLLSIDLHGMMRVQFCKANTGASCIPVLNVSDIPVSSIEITSGQAGLFLDHDPAKHNSDMKFEVDFSWGEVCEIRLRLGIWIDTDVFSKTEHAKGEQTGYSGHRAGAGRILMNRSHNPIKPATIAHESGHAKAYLDILKPLIETDLLTYFAGKRYWRKNTKNRARKDATQRIERLYANAAYIAESVKNSNDGTVSYYLNNPEYKRVFPAYVPPVFFDDNETIRVKEKKLDYLWEKK